MEFYIPTFFQCVCPGQVLGEMVQMSELPRILLDLLYSFIEHKTLDLWSWNIEHVYFLTSYSWFTELLI